MAVGSNGALGIATRVVAALRETLFLAIENFSAAVGLCNAFQESLNALRKHANALRDDANALLETFQEGVAQVQEGVAHFQEGVAQINGISDAAADDAYAAAGLPVPFRAACGFPAPVRG